MHFSYQWYCHIDDDIYVNIPQLSQLLQQYNPEKPYYIGNWPDFVLKHPFLQVSMQLRI